MNNVNALKDLSSRINYNDDHQINLHCRLLDYSIPYLQTQSQSMPLPVGQPDALLLSIEFQLNNLLPLPIVHGQCQRDFNGVTNQMNGKVDLTWMVVDCHQIDTRPLLRTEHHFERYQNGELPLKVFCKGNKDDEWFEQIVH